MKTADYANGSGLADVDKYDVSGISYDANGNILSLSRNAFDVKAKKTVNFDYLVYGYSGNQLKKVEDAGSSSGFKNGASVDAEYLYDANGNMTRDLNKGIKDIKYNELNLPESISFADGRKISYIYEYNICDHLGNIRAVVDGAGIVKQQSNYYPFGGVFAQAGKSDNKYLYNGKEKQEGTDWLDYGARMYSADLGRFMTVDPLAEVAPNWSPYRYGYDNPIKYNDPTGMFESTHTDEDGNVLAVYNDGDKGVYKHKDAKSKKDVDKKRKKSKSTSGGGERMGRTLTWWSFAGDSDGGHSYEGCCQINFGSFAARNWLNSTHPNGLSDYIGNAGNFGVYDYKTNGYGVISLAKWASHYYRGSQISAGVYASARDVGNLFAGMYGSVFVSKNLLLRVFGAYNANGNKFTLCGLAKHGILNMFSPTYGEKYESYIMQSIGCDMGLYPNGLIRNVPSNWKRKY